MWHRLVERVALVAAGCAASAAAVADQRGIVIDGQFDDWADVPPAYVDTVGDAPGGPDLLRLWLADDARFLFIRIELSAEIDGSENNQISFYLDTDSNAATGAVFYGLGIELRWTLGTRSGFAYLPGGTTAVGQHQLRFRGAPTVDSTQFEFAIGRDTLPDGQSPLFLGSTLRTIIRDGLTLDRIPNEGQTLSYTLDVGGPVATPALPIERASTSDLRIATWNTLDDGPWNIADGPRFGRLLAATTPDVLNFQEIYAHTAADAVAFVSTWIPLPPGESWHGVQSSDCITVSRYPIVSMWPLSGNLAAVLDTTPILGRHLLLVNAHPPCCNNETGRQLEIDQFMGFIRDARLSGGIGLGPATPVVIAGDMNLVGRARQLRTLLTGDIVNVQYGPDFAPDVDGSPLASVTSRQTDKRMGYTWRNDSNTFWPGQLDFIVYTDAVLEVANHFLLYTPEMPAARLAQYGLEAPDSLASDHLLSVADFRRRLTPGDMDCDGAVDFADIDVFVLALSGEASYLAAFPECLWRNADCNGDGGVDFADIDAFVALLGN